MLTYTTLSATGVYYSKSLCFSACCFRVYTHIEDVGLFLFNDALVFTHILTGHHAFERSVARTYLFKSSVSLVGLRLKDLSDTRCEFVVL